MRSPATVERGAEVWIPPPLVFLGALVAGLALRTTGFPLRHLVPRPIGAALGLALAGAGLALGAAAHAHFRRTGQHPAPWRPSPRLIEAGPYRFVRNPMYVGMSLLAIGIGLAANDPWISLLALPALWIVHRTAVLPEEAYLTTRFGPDYDSYRARVGRYLPRPPRSARQSLAAALARTKRTPRRRRCEAERARRLTASLGAGRVRRCR